MNKIRIGLVLAFIWVGFLQSYAQDVDTRPLKSFHEVKAGQGIDVYLKRGEEESARVEADGISAERVLTDVYSGRLRIHLEKGRYNNHSVKVYVTYKNIDGISASSASNITSLNVIEADNISLSASSAGDIEVEVRADEVDASASSAGDIELSGSVNYLEVSASSAGGVDAYDLKSNKVYARSSSGGGIKVNAKEEINARSSSGGSIRYRGNPTRSRTDSSSGGSVRKSS